jgi:parallel beta-helix repeat protein
MGNFIDSNNENGIYINKLYHRIPFNPYDPSIRNNIKGNTISNNGRRGIILYDSNTNNIAENNFINNEEDASFEIRLFSNSFANRWSKNYWNRARIFPKIIAGRLTFIEVTYPGFNIDWHPAKEPYDIEIFK